MGGMGGRGQRTEDRGQRAEGRGQRTEDRGQKTDKSMDTMLNQTAPV